MLTQALVTCTCLLQESPSSSPRWRYAKHLDQTTSWPEYLRSQQIPYCYPYPHSSTTHWNIYMESSLLIGNLLSLRPSSRRETSNSPKIITQCPLPAFVRSCWSTWYAGISLTISIYTIPVHSTTWLSQQSILWDPVTHHASRLPGKLGPEDTGRSRHSWHRQSIW